MINIKAKITSFDTVFSYNLQEFPEINTDNYAIEKVVSINGNFETAIVNNNTFTLTPNIFTDFEDNILVHLRYTSKKDINIVDKKAVEFHISVEGSKKTFILRNTGNTDTTFYIIHGASATDIVYYYRIDDNDIGFEYTQNTLSGTSTITKSYTIPAGKAFYIYAERWNAYWLISYNDKYFNRFSGISGDIRFDGDIRLINGGKSGCFCYLFEGCSEMVDSPELNFTKNDKYSGYSAYEGMFDGCTNLKRCPSRLPFTTIYGYGYARMFRNCKSLTSAPVIDATSITAYSMESMFEGCTSLINAPEIKVINLNSNNSSNPNCQMRYMFKGCTSMINPPDILPCTKLYRECYTEMFKGCTSLTKSTKFYTNTETNGNCFYGMFEGCTSLTQIMDLPADMKSLSAAVAMFMGCTSLTEIDLTFTDNYRSLGSMFQNCTSLTKASIKAPNIEYCSYMFSGCSNLSYIKLDTNSFSNNTNFTNGVAASGTFLKRANVDIPTGVDGIPSGWTVITIT
jgi:hypothetical protein